MERESRENLIERLTDRVSSLRRANKLQLREAIGQALDYFGIQGEEERDEFFTEIGRKLGERGAVSAKRKRHRTQKKQEAGREQANEHWRAEAERAGFENPEDLLKHLNE